MKSTDWYMTLPHQGYMICSFSSKLPVNCLADRAHKHRLHKQLHSVHMWSPMRSGLGFPWVKDMLILSFWSVWKTMSEPLMSCSYPPQPDYFNLCLKPAPHEAFSISVQLGRPCLPFEKINLTGTTTLLFRHVTRWLQVLSTAAQLSASRVHQVLQ